MKNESYQLYLDRMPQDDKFDRVHAVLVTDDGRVLVRYKNGDGRITGGHIDPSDKDMESALRRELLEEINCEIDKCDYLGYLKVRLENETVENWARMVARLAKIGKPQADPDRVEKWIYGRTLMPLEEAKTEIMKTFPFGDTGKLLKRAIEIANKQGYFTRPASLEKQVLNLEIHEEQDGAQIK